MVDRYPRRRNRLRYPGFDYAGPATIFVTICTENRQHLFGSFEDGQIACNAVGKMVSSTWQRIPARFPGSEIDAFIVMPDHLHGILFPGSDPDKPPVAVGDIVRWFKNATIRAYREGVTRHGWEPYDRQLWQDKFHDRIVRSDAELETVRTYIAGNPGRWWDNHLANADDPVPNESPHT